MAASTTTGTPRKSMLRSPITWVIILGVTLAGGAYILYRRNQANNAASSSSGSTTASTDPNATDNAGALSTLQTEIADLQSSASQQTPAPASPTAPLPDPNKTVTGTITKAPAVPPVITVVNPGIAAVDISWTAVPGATGYKLDITGPQGSAQASPTVSTTHARVDLPAGKKGLRVKVRAVNSAGAGPWSGTRTFSVGGRAPAATTGKTTGRKAA